MQSEFGPKGVQVAGVTEASAAEAERFLVEFGLTYPVIADARALFEAYGVEALWGSVVYLIDAQNRIVARGIDPIRKELAQEPR